MLSIKIVPAKYPQLFGGVGFHNNDAMLYHVMDKDYFEQYIAKTYREISPGFMRTFAGFYDWTKEAMNEFAEYYEQMQKITDTPMYITPASGKFAFSDDEIETYADNVAKRLHYLYFKKNVNHIRYYCFSNELSDGDYGILNDNLPKFKKYHEALYRAFMRYDLPIGLLATDAANYENWSSIDWAIKNMAPITEEYCVHIYEREHSIYDQSFYDFFYEKCKQVSSTALNNGKRVILGEMGIQNNSEQLTLGNGVVIDTCRYFEQEKAKEDCAIMLAEMTFAAINAGVFATVYWSYCDYPPPFSCGYSNGDKYARKWGERERFFSSTVKTKYNKWGMLTWEEDGKCHPKPHYWALALIAKYFKKHSYVLPVEFNDSLIRCAAIKNTDGSVSLGVINRHNTDVEIKLKCELFNKNIRVYEYCANNVPYNDFADMQPPADCIKPQDSYILKPFSLTVFTTDYLEKSKSAICLKCSEKNGVLCWKKSKDINHCYYRVFASESADFVPSEENQIASTVALSLKIKKSYKFYKVLSVDKSGNI